MPFQPSSSSTRMQNGQWSYLKSARCRRRGRRQGVRHAQSAVKQNTEHVNTGSPICYTTHTCSVYFAFEMLAGTAPAFTATVAAARRLINPTATAAPAAAATANFGQSVINECLTFRPIGNQKSGRWVSYKKKNCDGDEGR